MKPQALKATIPVGVEKILLAAATDPALREALLRERAGVAKTLGIELSSEEEAILQSAPEPTLRAMISGIRTPDHRRRRFMQAVAAASAAALVRCDEDDADGVPLMDAGGARPDDAGPDADATPQGDADLTDAAPDTGTVDASLLEDAGMSWGSRPDPDGSP